LHPPAVCATITAAGFAAGKFYFRRLLFEENNQHTGDCALTGRFAATVSPKPPGIAVNNHQEEK